MTTYLQNSTRRGSYYRSQEDIRAGRVYKAKSGQDMLNQILSKH